MTNAPNPPPAPQDAAPATPGTVTDPYRAYNFKLEIQGVVEGHFTALDFPGVTLGVIKYREAGDRNTVRMIPGQVDYQPITLHYGLTSSRELFDWLMTAVNGNVDRKNVSIIILDAAGATEVVRWNLSAAWVAAWRGATLDALNHEIAIESVTLVYEALERA